MDYEEIKASEIKLRLFSFKVQGTPPYKQIAADAREKANQRERVDGLQEVARLASEGALIDIPTNQGGICLSITYRRSTGRCDAANVIGGIADALQGIAYVNDSQIAEVHYIEEGSDESYEVMVSIN